MTAVELYQASLLHMCCTMTGYTSDKSSLSVGSHSRLYSQTFLSSSPGPDKSGNWNATLLIGKPSSATSCKYAAESEIDYVGLNVAFNTFCKKCVSVGEIYQVLDS